MNATSEFPAGVWPVMLTPFDAGSVDHDALAALTDWYIDAGVAGLFAVCLSSEMYELTPEERVAVAERVAERADGRVPVVATGTFGGPVEAQAETVAAMAATGVDAVVAVASQLVDAGASDRRLGEALGALADATDAPLGLYECPLPHHRTVPPDVLADLAATGRVHFLKETSRDPETVARKVEAARGTPLRVYNAHYPTLLPTLEAGAAGYSGVAANYYPDLLVWLCEHHADEPETAAALDRFLTLADHAIRRGYPTSAKRYLADAGLDVEPVSRRETDAFEPGDRRTLDALAAQVGAWRDRLDAAGAG